MELFPSMHVKLLVRANPGLQILQIDAEIEQNEQFPTEQL
jgi:hypothetical protein